MATIVRRRTPTALIGPVAVGSDHPVVVQSMTNTDTADIASTVLQVAALAGAGSELVRVTVNNDEAAAAVPAIVEELDRIGVSVPIIGDFHYNGHLLLTKYPDCARALAKYRINPGNVAASGTTRTSAPSIEVALENEQAGPHRRELGSLDQDLLTEMMDANARAAGPRDARDVTMEAMVDSALRSAALAERIGLAPRPHHSQRQGVRRAGPGGRLSHARRALRLSAASRPDRSGARHQGHRREHRRALASSCRKASAIRSASR